MALNCWEFKECGRDPGARNAKKLRVCPASVYKKACGIHHGHNAGRCCWVVAGTFCGGEPQGTFAKKIVNCLECDFYGLVAKEEEKKFLGVAEIQEQIK